MDSNSTKIIMLAYEYFSHKVKNNTTFSFYELPPGITKEMMYIELKCIDLDSYIDNVDVEYLWEQYVYIHTSYTNIFGFTDLPRHLIQNNLSKSKSLSKSLHMKRDDSVYPGNSVKMPKWSIKQKSLSKRDSSSNGKSTSRGGSVTKRNYNKVKRIKNVQYGSGGNSVHLAEVVANINNGGGPVWRGRYSTFIKIKNINDKKIYVRGSSIPDPNKIYTTSVNPTQIMRTNYCTNLLNFYRFVMDIPKIISLQGCDLDWSFLPSYTPGNCVNVNELENWNETCVKYDEPDVNTGNNMSELYWVDMCAGYFNVFDTLSKIDFTNPLNYSVIHCLAGCGRTGTTLLLIICLNYYKGEKRRFNADFCVNSRMMTKYDKSFHIVMKLIELLINHIELDVDIPDVGLTPNALQNVKQSIRRFDLSHIPQEIFGNMISNYHGYASPNLTHINVFITRINYIIYFTTLRNKIKKFPLFQLKHPDYFTINPINSKEELYRHVLCDQQIYTHAEVKQIMDNPSKMVFGFDLYDIDSDIDDIFLTIPESGDVDITQVNNSRCSIS